MLPVAVKCRCCRSSPSVTAVYNLLLLCSCHILAMIFSAPRSCFSGKTLLVPCMVTLLYCSRSSLYTPGGKVLGTLSSVSLGFVAAGAAAVAGAAGLAPGEEVWMLLLIALCVATNEALRASR